jgi:succinyl-CoA synthetase beta subunit
MNIHEYQAKSIFKSYGVQTPRGIVATTPKEAVRAAEELGGDLWVVKAQIHAGGRGLGGGVKLARSIEEVEELADQILGMTLCHIYSCFIFHSFYIFITSACSIN